MTRRGLCTLLVLFAAGIGHRPSDAEGQAVTRTLVGTITDQTGAAIPNALISITNEVTGAVATANRNESGNYTFTFLTPGTYAITVTASGFRKYITSGVNGQNAYSGLSLVALDASLQQDIPIHEGIGLALRVPAFNALNHPVFANPNTTTTSTSFGQVTATLGSAGNFREQSCSADLRRRFTSRDLPMRFRKTEETK
jgi:hypothetical protein